MIHKGEMPFQCNICQKKFRERSNLNFHIKKHKNKEIIKKIIFKNVKKHKNNKRNLIKKEIIYTKFPNFLYKCIYCGKEYKNNNRFEIHMRVHVSFSFIYFL
jgi:uncharacterized Zn-finger protein